jgi:hypothetical protein
MSENASNTGSSTGTPTPEGQEVQEQIQSVAPQKKKFKYKADGAEFEEELGDDEITNRLSLAKAAQKRMAESATSKRQIAEFVKQLKEDPMSVLSDERIMGSKKFREIAEQFLLKQIEEESLSPQEREYKEKERKLSEYERKDKERQEQEQQAKAKQLESHYTQTFEKTIISALESSSLPKNVFTVKRMAELMQKNLQHGLDLEPQQLAQLVKEDYLAEQRAVIGSASAEQLIAMFGDEVANKIRKHDLSKFQVKNPEPKQYSQRSEEPQKKMSSREYDEYLRNKFKK